MSVRFGVFAGVCSLGWHPLIALGLAVLVGELAYWAAPEAGA